MGAGIVECDVTFTKDKQLVCRHAQNDLHTTTNILADAAREDSASGRSHPRRSTPTARSIKPASAECRTSEITLAEFKTLTRQDGRIQPDARHGRRSTWTARPTSARTCIPGRPAAPF